MTQSEIDKSDNELIAEFMGGQPNSDKSYWYFPIPQNEYNHIENFKYDTSWDWLMSVVEKIRSLLQNNELYDRGKKLWDWICIALSTTEIKAVYIPVVEFIKWYNSHNNGK